MSRGRGLSAQLFLDVLRSFLVGGAVFALLFGGSSYVLDRTVYGDNFSGQLTDRRFSDLQDYVLEEGVTADFLQPLDSWRGGSGRTYLTIYLADQLLYESYTGAQGNPDREAYSPALEDPDREYALVLSDGVCVQAFLYCYAGSAYYYWSLILAGAAAFLAFSLCFINFVHKKIRYIQRMKAELDILAGGDLSYPVTVRTGDELGELAAGIDQMRRSIAAHQAAEEQARWANSQLVTAMSHDLRTPLTSLLAYLELMERGRYEDEEQLAHFIHRSLEKTMQIKSMADKLFEYFLVYTASWEPPNLEWADGDELFQHQLGEYAFSLESHGFTVSYTQGRLEGRLRVDLDLLRRVFDNLYANLLKYADTSVPIQMTCWREGESVRLTLCNGIAPRRDKWESTNIGLNTCERVLRRHGGTFSYREEGEQFIAELTLPLVPCGQTEGD